MSEEISSAQYIASLQQALETERERLRIVSDAFLALEERERVAIEDNAALLWANRTLHDEEAGKIQRDDAYDIIRAEHPGQLFLAALQSRERAALAEVERQKEIYAELLQQSLKTTLEAVNADTRADDAERIIDGILAAWEGRTSRAQLVWFAGEILKSHDKLLSHVTDLATELAAARELRRQIPYPNLDDPELDSAIERYDAARQE